MNGSESLIKTLVNSGVEVCFTNPGTSEMHFVAALDEVEGMRCVLGLFEGVVSGAADGYARMAGKPAATLLHLGPGLGNALANIHNAKKGNVPMINIVGDHATYHLQYDAPLTADIEGIAAPVSHWVHTSKTPADIASDAVRAVLAAGHNHIATLILPADVSWGDNPAGAAPAPQVPAPKSVAPEKIEAAVAMLRCGAPAMILVGGKDVSADTGIMLARLAQCTGARVCLETFPTRVARGAGRGRLEKLPYLAEQAIKHLHGVEKLILLGAKSPVSFFAYPNVPSALIPENCEELQLALPDEDIAGCLQHLLAALDGEDAQPQVNEHAPPPLPQGALDPVSLAQSIAAQLPTDAIIVDDAGTGTLTCYPAATSSAPHDWLTLTGGSIGFGLPCAVGTAVACPERKTICLEGDGSAMYTIQALWTMARENLDITVVIFGNQKYSILELEFLRTGARGGVPGPKAASMLNIGGPDMDFVATARGMGVDASRATTAEEFNRQFAGAMAGTGPYLIEAMVPPISL
ncbi:MAG: acetolactate synthase large subunit [Halioglobus sp.]|nr:acetolactate synthase large subunit [Halioglobus sp.]